MTAAGAAQHIRAAAGALPARTAEHDRRRDRNAGCSPMYGR